TISGIVGFGSSIMLMPVLVIVFGPLHAVPIMAIAAILANLSRVLIWWRAVAAYAVTGVPAAALGARTLLVLPPRLIECALGVFFLLMIPARRWLAARGFRLRLPHLLALGAVIGFLTGIVVTTGPITAPIFLAYGLVKGAFIATEAASSLAVYLSKSAVFRRFGALPLPVITQGLITGASLMAGAWIAKRFVLRLHPDRFRLVMDALMLLSGATMLWTAFR
ncbi:MAG TPA: sulfite exporter TauE/SafE family protein, partial [Candidatus Eisenbacteria bacterium]|nr:sulfite exporter TauE/SafE family protein [Candidatus Eisenbacteria bacterium]